MSEEELARLFTPFSTAFDGGTGLGMAIVCRIVEEHGGAIDVESTPGEGTTVTILLPRNAGRPDAGASGEPARGGRTVSGPRLLIVDDEAIASRHARLLFHKRGLRGRDGRQLHRRPGGGRALQPGRRPLRHQDARTATASTCCEGRARRTPRRRHHDHRPHLDRRRDRGDEARRDRLHRQALRHRGARARRAARARREAPAGRERLPPAGARRQVHLRQHHRPRPRMQEIFRTIERIGKISSTV